MDYANILVTREGPVATVALSRPPVNALNLATIRELKQAFGELSNDSSTRAVLVTSAVQGIFIAGADVLEMARLTPEEGAEMLLGGQDLFDHIEEFPKPVVAAINGVCLGGGLELALACDFRVAAESARFGLPEITLGILPGWGGLQRLPRLIGKARALEVILTGDSFKSSEALQFGLLNRVVADNELLAQSKNLARRLAMQAPLAVAKIKRRVFEGADQPQAAAIQQDAKAFMELFGTYDAKEGLTAFAEKRKPKFQGQ
ncbi:MAG: enoyl-CoA hydratase-related protein [Chloroflexi bacterium]|nr:enoyl-CoA hydratase-related protein [Chloroflexota bacterium]